MLAPDLNRSMTTGVDCTDQLGTSQACLETQERKTHGNPMATPRENDKLTMEQPAQGIDERIHKDSKLTELKPNPHEKKRHHRTSTHKS